MFIAIRKDKSILGLFYCTLKNMSSAVHNISYSSTDLISLHRLGILSSRTAAPAT